MDLYSRKQRWKLVLAAVAMLIVGASLYYSSRIVKKIREEERQRVQLWAQAVQNRAQLVNYTDSLFHRLREEERKRVELWAEATVRLVSSDQDDLTFYLKVVSDNTTIPVVITDADGRVAQSRNLDPAIAQDSVALREAVKAMGLAHPPIPIALGSNYTQYLYYKDSRIVTELEQVMDNIIRSFISETVMNTAAVPVIFTDSTRTQVIEHSNIDTAEIADPEKLKARIALMAQANTPIEVSLAGRGRNYIFYEESRVITQLRYFPYVQLIIIGLFLLVSYALFSVFRNAEQNQVWVGMAKETAHQLGTPLSSLMAWIEILKGSGTDPSAITEMRKDVDRLEVITERFSKIGSAPALTPEKLYHTLRATVLYLRPRLPGRVQIDVVPPSDMELEVPLNRALFSWVLENLIRNAVDAMEGTGSITIEIAQEAELVHVDVTDTGKGIPVKQFRRVFQPGFTTKKRGWGLGLSLSKRIIEQYHSGRILVKRSAPGKGTTFRITLNA
ncbi:MAG TPA: HAMP domain-containing sensor histidine kinase [Flavobacteriales bacterium]|jgi:signal transduction histidine kinase|nr:HAMP domain-containing sensor histidine kinase [Flavobacteriales bacterium]